jgi:hypothetical protein
MKKIFKTLLAIYFIPAVLNLCAAPDQFIRLFDEVKVTNESDQWLKVAVPFEMVNHPLKAKYETIRTPATKDQVINLNYLNNLKIRLSICFSNELQKEKLRNQKLPDAEFYQYYSSEIELLTIKADRNKKYATFLFPSAIAERDGFLNTYVKPIGYVVEIIYDGIPLEISKSIYFGKYKEESILSKFRQQCQANAPQNEGILIPAYLVSTNYLQGLGPVKRQAGAGGSRY